MPADTRPGDSCPLCPTFSNVALTPVTALTPIPVKMSEATVFSVRADILTGHAPDTQALPRAPPYLIV
jgi:hypothetical protein